MIWLIRSLDLLAEGRWPAEPINTGYTDIPGHKIKTQAYFVTPVEFHAEVSYRLERTGKAGTTLKWEIQHGLTDYEYLAPEAKMALNYISVWRRRESSFSQWSHDQKKRRR